MKNEELIKAARICANQTCCDNCPRYDIDHTQDAQRCCIQLINDAADALEAAEKRIEEQQKQIAKLYLLLNNRINAIEELTKTCTELEAQIPKWVSVKDGLPKFDAPVLVTYIGCNTGEIRCDLLATYNGIEWRYWDCEPLNVVSVEITHWMELPEPPKGE